MTIKDQMIELIKIGQTPNDELNKLELVAKLTQLQADISKDECVVGIDVFEAMDQDSRKIALTGYVWLLMAQIQ